MPNHAGVINLAAARAEREEAARIKEVIDYEKVAVSGDNPVRIAWGGWGTGLNVCIRQNSDSIVIGADQVDALISGLDVFARCWRGNPA